MYQVVYWNNGNEYKRGEVFYDLDKASNFYYLNLDAYDNIFLEEQRWKTLLEKNVNSNKLFLNDFQDMGDNDLLSALLYEYSSDKDGFLSVNMQIEILNRLNKNQEF